MTGRTATKRRVIVRKNARGDMGRYWEWHCPCCTVTSGYKYKDWAMAFWAASRHVSYWHGPHWQLRRAERNMQYGKSKREAVSAYPPEITNGA